MGVCRRGGVEDGDVGAVDLCGGVDVSWMRVNGWEGCKYFVPGEGIEVDVQGFHVYFSMRRICDAVDTEHSSGNGVHLGCDFFDIVDGSENVTCVCAGYQSCFFRQQGAQIFRSEG